MYAMSELVEGEHALASFRCTNMLHLKLRAQDIPVTTGACSIISRFAHILSGRFTPNLKKIYLLVIFNFAMIQLFMLFHSQRSFHTHF